MDEILKELREYVIIRYSKWVNTELFAFNWWLLLAILIVPWIIWWKLADKTRAKEILIYGGFVALVISLLDETGSLLGHWAYQYELYAPTPRLNPIDLTALPVAYMLMYQYGKSWRSFILFQTAFSLFGSFIAEPFFIHIGIYEPITWQHIYSFPSYILLGVITKFVVDRFFKMLERESKPNK